MFCIMDGNNECLAINNSNPNSYNLNNCMNRVMAECPAKYYQDIMDIYYPKLACFDNTMTERECKDLYRVALFGGKIDDQTLLR